MIKAPWKIASAAALALGGVAATHSGYQVREQWAVVQGNLASDTFAERADAWIVLTGGEGRVKEALTSAREGQRVLISGAHPETSLDEILEALELFEEDLAISKEDITLLDFALNTRGNGIEVRAWLQNNPDVENIVVVTSDYHTPRTNLNLQEMELGDVNVRYRMVENGANTQEWLMETAKVGCQTFEPCRDLFMPKQNIRTQARLKTEPHPFASEDQRRPEPS